MRKYKRENYNIESYKNERYMLLIWDETTGWETTVYSDKWEPLYARAKEEATNGRECEIWGLKYKISS